MLICIKDNTNAMIAISTSSLKHVEMSSKDMLAENNLPYFLVKNNPHTIVAGNNSPLLIDILRYNNEIFKGTITLKRIITEIFPQIKKICEDYKMVDKEGNIPTSLIVAQNNKAFMISPYGLVTEVEDFEVIGWYKDVVKGSLSKHKTKSIKERLQKAFEESFVALGGYEKGYFYIDTLNQKINIIQ